MSFKDTKIDAMTVSLCGCLVATSIVLTRVVGVTFGPYRLQFGDLPIILAGMLLGPIPGAIVGFVADVVGGIWVGYAINPVITIGAACIGLVAGVVYGFLSKLPDGHPVIVVGVRCLRAIGGAIRRIVDAIRSALWTIGMVRSRPKKRLEEEKERDDWPERFRVLLTVMLAHLIGSAIVKTIGLAAYGYAWPVLVGRVPFYMALGLAEWLVLVEIKPRIQSRLE